MTDDNYNLYRPLLMQGAESFADVFATSARWEFDTEHTFPPRELYGNEVGPYCSVRTPTARWSMDVVPNDEVMRVLDGRVVTDDDRLSFQIIEHAETGRALVICQHSQAIGSHWLAYIDPRTIPYRPEVER